MWNLYFTAFLSFYLLHLATQHAVEFQLSLVFEVRNTWGRNKGVEVKRTGFE